MTAKDFYEAIGSVMGEMRTVTSNKDLRDQHTH